MFLLTRISGACIILFALIGMASALMMGARTQMDLGTLMRWIFFPNSFHVVTSVAEIEPGWTNNTWRIMQMLVALLGLTHGFNGLREVLEDYIKGNGWQIAIRILILFMWLFMLWAAYWLIQTG
ncbi:MAG: hypothetical protein WCI88_00395 [Chloroflexota bacterium]